ncbi:MAG: type I polyketide synthase, partial [Myxococcota bacterium]
GMLSPDGRCKTFDASANGYVRGEGAAMVVLKRLSAAIEDGDPIHAVVHGTAANQDGRTKGITVPNGEAQKAVARAACERAQVAPHQIGYVEAHGTGTPVGDPIEARALGELYGAGRETPCVIGSVKTNIGHLEAAAGVAGLIKAALCLKHQAIPPHLLQTPNPAIPFDELGIRIPKEVEVWPSNETPFVGINSFGFGGTNAHAILGPPPSVVHPSQAGASSSVGVVPLSARSADALKDLAHNFDAYLSSHDDIDIDDVTCAVANRTHHHHRAAFVASSIDELRKQLSTFARGEPAPRVYTGTAPSQSARHVWIFSGMGPQWWAMGREFLQIPLFQETLEQIDELFSAMAGWSLLTEMKRSESTSQMDQTRIAQPANFAVQVGVASVLQSWGLQPDAVLGHSAGEAAAAYVAGAMDLSEATRLIYHRSRLQQLTTGLGKLLAVDQTREEVERLVADAPEVSVAALNSPSSATLVGEPKALEKIAAQLEAQGRFNRFLSVNVPFHSHYMDPIREQLFEVLADLRLTPTQTPLYSTVTGQRVEGSALDAEYWWRNVREPVYFAEAINALLADGYTGTFIEIAPHPVLRTSIVQCAEARGQSVTAVGTLNRKHSEMQAFREGLAQLYATGTPLNWKANVRAKRAHSLPRYAWQHQRYWQESDDSRRDRQADLDHGLLGRSVEAPEPTWRHVLSTSVHSVLADHKVQGAVVYPGAAYVEMAVAAARALSTANCTVELEDFSFDSAAFLDEDAYQVETRVSTEDMKLRIYGRGTRDEGWKKHAQCRIRVLPTHAGETSASMPISPSGEPLDPSACYADLSNQGLQYGPRFQSIKSLQRVGSELVAEIEAHPDVAQLSGYYLHPALLDACFQLLLIRGFDSIEGTYLPVGISSLKFHRAVIGPALRAHAHVTRADDAVLEGNLRLYGPDGALCVSIDGVRAVSLDQRSSKRLPNAPFESLFGRFDWNNALAPLEGEPAISGQTWCIFADERGWGTQLADVVRQQEGRAIVVHAGPAG